MRNPNRIYEMLRTLSKIWLKYPHLRLGQLLLNVCQSNKDLYYMEDEQLLENLKRLYKKE